MRKSRRKYLKTIRRVSLNFKKTTLRVTGQRTSLQDFSHTYGSSRKIKKWTLNIYGHATIQLIYLQKLFRLQHSENTSMVSECGICVTCDEKAMSTIIRGDYDSVLFFPCHGFCPNEFFHDSVFNEALCNTR